MRGIIWVKQAPARRRRARQRAVAACAAAAVAAWGAWHFRADLPALGRRAQAAGASGLSWLKENRDLLGLSSLGKPAAARPAGPTAASAPAGDAPAPAAPPAREAPAAQAAPAADNAPPKTDDWPVRGRVYDLYSLKPVAKAQIVFTAQASGESVRAHTDSEGRYALRLPRLAEGGYDISVRHRGYQDDYLEENEPPYRTQDLERRQEAAALLMQSAVLHVPFRPPEKEVVVELPPSAAPAWMPGMVAPPSQPTRRTIAVQPAGGESVVDLVLLPRR